MKKIKRLFGELFPSDMQASVHPPRFEPGPFLPPFFVPGPVIPPLIVPCPVPPHRINLGELQRSTSSTSSFGKNTSTKREYFGVHKWVIEDLNKATRYIGHEGNYIRTSFLLQMDGTEVRFHLAIGRRISTDDPFVLSISYYTNDDQIEYGAMVNLDEYTIHEKAVRKKIEIRRGTSTSKVRECLYRNWRTELSNDVLTIYFHFVVEYFPTHLQTTEQRETNPTFQIRRDDLENISDFTIHCGEKSFPVHKIVLANSSKVFHAMFSHNEFDENKTNESTIKDLEPRTVNMMVEVMYSHHLQEGLLSSDLENLLEASNMYDFEYLRSKCEQRLLAKFLNNNCCAHLLYVGLKFNSEKLANSARKMVLKSIYNICQTKQFTELMTTYPDALEMKL